MGRKIFISYRREDSKHAVGRLYEALKKHVSDPRRDIFMDIDDIPRGVDYVEYLGNKVAECDVLFAVIGPAWLTVKDPNTGARRLDQANDFVRIEIAEALRRGIPVVPLFLDDTGVPAEADLPADLQPLHRRNGDRLRHESFDADVARLMRSLPDAKPKPTQSPRARPDPETRPQPEPAAATPSAGLPRWLLPAGLAGLAVVAGVWLFNQRPAPAPIVETPKQVVEASPLETIGREPEIKAAQPQAGAKPPSVRTADQMFTLNITGADGASLKGDPYAGERVFRQCAACHSLAPGVNRVGPSLHGVISRKAGSVSGYPYSEANMASGIVWTDEALFTYLERPRQMILGTTMAFAGLRSPQDRANVIAYIRSKSE